VNVEKFLFGEKNFFFKRLAIRESGVFLKMLRILKKALAELRYRAGCHRKGHVIILNTQPALRPSLLSEKGKVSTFRIKVFC
jgi:hypothetical protein